MATYRTFRVERDNDLTNVWHITKASGKTFYLNGEELTSVETHANTMEEAFDFIDRVFFGEERK